MRAALSITDFRNITSGSLFFDAEVIVIPPRKYGKSGFTCSCDTGYIVNPARTGDGMGCTDIGLHVRGPGAEGPEGRERVNRYVGCFESKWRRSG